MSTKKHIHVGLTFATFYKPSVVWQDNNTEETRNALVKYRPYRQGFADVNNREIHFLTGENVISYVALRCAVTLVW